MYTFSQKLFETPNCTPMIFHLAVKDADVLTQYIQFGGGIVDSSPKGPYTIIISDDCCIKTAGNYGSRDVFHRDFLLKCCKGNTLCALKKLRLRKSYFVDQFDPQDILLHNITWEEAEALFSNAEVAKQASELSLTSIPDFVVIGGKEPIVFVERLVLPDNRYKTSQKAERMNSIQSKSKSEDSKGENMLSNKDGSKSEDSKKEEKSNNKDGSESEDDSIVVDFDIAPRKRRTDTSSRCLRRRNYTLDEDMKILSYIVSHKGYDMLGSILLWQRMHRVRPTILVRWYMDLKEIPQHTWQSLKEHFRVKLAPNIDKYGLSADVVELFKIYARFDRGNTLKRLYSADEDRIILNFMKSRGLKSNNLLKPVLWQELAELIKGRSWQSVRNRYVQHIQYKMTAINGESVNESGGVKRKARLKSTMLGNDIRSEAKTKQSTLRVSSDEPDEEPRLQLDQCNDDANDCDSGTTVPRFDNITTKEKGASRGKDVTSESCHSSSDEAHCIADTPKPKKRQKRKLFHIKTNFVSLSEEAEKSPISVVGSKPNPVRAAVNKYLSQREMTRRKLKNNTIQSASLGGSIRPLIRKLSNRSDSHQTKSTERLSTENDLKSGADATNDQSDGSNSPGSLGVLHSDEKVASVASTSQDPKSDDVREVAQIAVENDSVDLFASQSSGRAPCEPVSQEPFEDVSMLPWSGFSAEVLIANDISAEFEEPISKSSWGLGSAANESKSNLKRLVPPSPACSSSPDYDAWSEDGLFWRGPVDRKVKRKHRDTITASSPIEASNLINSSASSDLSESETVLLETPIIASMDTGTKSPVAAQHIQTVSPSGQLAGTGQPQAVGESALEISREQKETHSNSETSFDFLACLTTDSLTQEHANENELLQETSTDKRKSCLTVSGSLPQVSDDLSAVGKRVHWDDEVATRRFRDIGTSPIRWPCNTKDAATSPVRICKPHKGEGKICLPARSDRCTRSFSPKSPVRGDIVTRSSKVHSNHRL